MNAAGIDVSSRKSTVAVLRPFGEVVKLPFDVRHSAEDLAALAAQLKSIDGETRVVMEHTGRYYESIAKVLHEAGLYVSAVNPLLIKEYGNNSLRKVKTDKADAMKIAKYALDNWTELRDYTPMDTIRYELKTLNRQFQLASKQKTATANNLIALQEQSFPGIRKLFHVPDGASLLAAIIVLAIMILPSIIKVSVTALEAVPKEYEDASLALGATPVETYLRVSVPAAKSGIAAAVVLGVGRAIGEAMAVMMVSGNACNMPSLFESVRFLTTAVASEMSYSSGLQRQALFSIALVLFLFIMLLNATLNFFLKRNKEG